MSKITPPNKPPSWLVDLMEKGYVPYIATSEHLLPAFDLKPFGVELKVFTLENEQAHPFLESYLLSNSLSFQSPNYKMPSWVFVDCVLLQQAIVGFMKPKESFPDNMLDHYKNDSAIDFESLTHIPVSGQIDAHAPDGSLVNYSLFSLGRDVDGTKNVGLYTKLLSLKTNKAEGKEYHVIAQYDSPSIKVHGRVSKMMFVEQPMVPLHPSKDMTFVLKMKIADDLSKVIASEETKPSFWINAQDTQGKRVLQQGAAKGKKYIIPPPYSMTEGDDILLPIIEQTAKIGG